MFYAQGRVKCSWKNQKGIKPYVCETCGRSFSQKNDMLKHAKTHNSKLMQCGHCNEVFKRKKDMLKHIATHEQETSVIPDYVGSPLHILQAYVGATDFGDWIISVQIIIHEVQFHLQRIRIRELTWIDIERTIIYRAEYNYVWTLFSDEINKRRNLYWIHVKKETKFYVFLHMIHIIYNAKRIVLYTQLQPKTYWYNEILIKVLGINIFILIIILIIIILISCGFWRNSFSFCPQLHQYSSKYTTRWLVFY